VISSSRLSARWLLYLLFFLSGFTGLVYEISWSRILSTILGNTSLAITVVVSIFLGGLALGSFIAPRVSLFQRNPLRTYAFLEFLVAGYSACTPWLGGWVDQIYSLGYAGVASHFWLSIFLKAIITALLFLLPAVAMGATLPVLVRCFPEEQRRHTAGFLYGINTAGAVLGTLLCGYFLLPNLGIKTTVLSTAVINLTIGLLALFLSTRMVLAEIETRAGVVGRFHPAYLLVLLTGFASLSFEILWTRALSMFFGSSVYAFSSILSAFLLGIACGSSYYSKRIPEGADPYQFFSLVQFRICLAAIFFLGIFMGVPYLLIWFYQSLHHSFPLFQAAQFLLIGATVFYATFLSGAAFPAALHFFRNQSKDLPRHVANIYTFNTVGSIAGTICAGFILIPTLGVERSIRLMGLLNLILGMVCFRKSHPKHHDRKVLAIGGVCLLLLVFLPQWNQSIYNSGFYAFAYKYVPRNVSEGGRPCLPFFESSDCMRAGTPALRSRSEAGLLPVPRSTEELSLIYYGEGLTATIAVVEQQKGIRTLLINGKPDASNVPTGDMRTQLLLGHLPALLKGRSEEALVIGLGSGVTSGALVTHGVRRIDCVEIEKKVAQAARYFDAENLRVMDRKIFRLILDDGRNFVRHSSGRYDVITSEPSNLWMSGVANLFTREFFDSAKRKLKPGGVMCQWIHLYQISLEDVLIFLKTFQSVFPHLSIWIDESDMLVLGADQPIPLNRDILLQRMSEPAVWWSLQRSSITPDYLFQRYIGDEKMMKVIRKSIPLKVVDHPILEFSAPKSLFVNDAERIARSLIAFQKLAALNKE
jgi:spermidine synthase